ncbi:MAG: divergent polysaccharide deacetylase family protein [Nitrospinota bacterium]
MKKRNSKKGKQNKTASWRGMSLRGRPLLVPALFLLIGVGLLASTFFLYEPQQQERSAAVIPVPPPPPAPEKKEPPMPRLAIVIDDVGVSKAPIKKLIALRMPLTFAILPSQRHSTELANVINDAGYEVIIHIPMEPDDINGNNPGKSALLVSQSDQTIREEIKKMIQEIPHAVGTSNHMGSKFTKNYDKMRCVLEEIKSSGLYFLDSRTTADSVAFKLARQMGVKSSSRRVFIDNELDTEAIKNELRRSIRYALSKGEAIAIGHPHKQTIMALAQMKESIENAGIELVPASSLAR